MEGGTTVKQDLYVPYNGCGDGPLQCNRESRMSLFAILVVKKL